MAFFKTLEKRRAGIMRPSAAAEHVRSSRLSRLELNVDVEIKSPHHGPITWLDVDTAEERYLLTGGADCTIALFDLDGAGVEGSATAEADAASHAALSNARRTAAVRRSTAAAAAARRRRPRELRELGRTPRVPLSRQTWDGPHCGHRHSISVVQWYPVDTGLFVSGAMDGFVKVWDTNTLDVVLEFDFKDKVFAAAMSASIGQHNLIAVGSDSPQARLSDIRSGGFAHTLSGHSEAVWACKWSPTSEFLLATGSADHTVRLWDIRRAGASACLISLDRHQEEEEEEEEEEEDVHEIRGAGGSGGVEGESDEDGGGTPGGGGGRGGKGSRRGYLRHVKLAPHASRASKFARAHAGPVNSLCFSVDGSRLLTAGTDNRLRLWHVDTGRNTMTNYLRTLNKRRRPFGMAAGKPAGSLSETVFFPNDKSGDVLVIPMHTPDGRPKGHLRGAHFDPVQCCAYRPRTQELVTCSSDGLVLLWSAAEPPWTSRASYLPEPLANGAGGTKRRLGQWEDAEDQDMWSSDEDGGGGVAGGSSLSGLHTAEEALGGGGGRVVGVRGGASASRGGIDGGGRVARGRGDGSGVSRGVFVPRILTQGRRGGAGSGGR